MQSQSQLIITSLRTMAKTYINVISWNINGLESHIKSRKALTYLKFKNTDIAFIQELHIVVEEEAVKFKKGWLGKVYHISYLSKRNGELIINKNQEDLSLVDIWRLVNPHEREYLFLSQS